MTVRRRGVLMGFAGVLMRHRGMLTSEFVFALFVVGRSGMVALCSVFVMSCSVLMCFVCHCVSSL